MVGEEDRVEIWRKGGRRQTTMRRGDGFRTLIRILLAVKLFISRNMPTVHITPQNFSGKSVTIGWGHQGVRVPPNSFMRYYGR